MTEPALIQVTAWVQPEDTRRRYVIEAHYDNDTVVVCYEVDPDRAATAALHLTRKAFGT